MIQNKNRKLAKTGRPRNRSAAKTRRFLELAERFRAATDSKRIRAMGDQLGRLVFGE